jgi:LysR family transcriptional regulator, transcription activator of glutamate synthase operon
MNIEQLESIVEVAKTRSFSIAAKNLHVTQSGLSNSIMKLEKEFGFRIFNRSRFGTLPTEFGEKIIDKASEIIIKLHELREEVLFCSSHLNKELKISATPGWFMTVLPRTLPTFKHNHPDVNIEVTEKTMPEIINEVLHKKIDIGLIAVNKSRWKGNEEIDSEIFGEGKLHVLVSKESPLASHTILHSSQLAGSSIVFYNSDNFNTFVKKMITKTAMNILFASNNTDLIKKMIAEGSAISFLNIVPFQKNGQQETEKIACIPLEDFNHVSIMMSIRSKKSPFTQPAKDFLQCLKIDFSNS